MCAVVGASLFDVTDDDILFVKKIILESRIRGLHATGVSYYKNNKLHTLSEPVSAKEFFRNHNINDFVDGNSLRLIAHCRYSTSDLNYNQPIDNGNMSIVHNGVISQELPENWETLYGIKTKTKNDTELLLHTVAEEKNPFSVWKDASISAIELHSDTLRYYRNGKRPLYYTKLPKGFVITSTQDIIKRVNPRLESIRTKPGTVYTIKNLDLIESSQNEISDLQP